MRSSALIVLTLFAVACAGLPGLDPGDPCNAQGVCVEGLVCNLDGICEREQEAGRWERALLLDSDPLTAAWGRHGADIYAVGSSVGHHFDGESWRLLDPAPPSGSSYLAGNSSELFVATSGSIYRQAGTTWQKEALMDEASAELRTTIKGLLAIGEQLIALTDDDGLLVRQGSSWRPFAAPRANLRAAALAWVDNKIVVAGSGTSYVAIYGADGSFERELALPARGSDYQLRAVWGARIDELVVVGENENLLSYDGESWGEAEAVTGRSVWGVGERLYVAGDRGLWACNASHCVRESVGESSTASLSSLWGDGAGVAVVVGSDGAFTRSR